MAIFTESYCKSILENKSSYSFHGVNLNCYDAENPDNKPAGEEPPTGEDGIPLKPGE